MDLVTNQSKGLQTAWLLSTLGSKTSSRSKIIRKDDLLSISIPKICNELINFHRDNNTGINIRFSSNVLHGISILYKSKTMQVLTEVAHVQLRLQNAYRQLQTGQNDQFAKPNGTRAILKRSDYLENDFTFHVGSDLMPRLELPECGMADSPEVKRRKLKIAEFDLHEFSLFDSTTEDNTTSVTGVGPFALVLGNQADANLEDFELSTHNHELGKYKDDGERINLQFNEDGDILEIQGQDMEDVRGSSEDIEIEQSCRTMEDVSLELHARDGIVEDIKNQKSFHDDSSDLNFQVTRRYERHGTESRSAVAPVGLFSVPNRKLVVDENICLTRESILTNHDNYATIMNYRASLIPQRRQLQQVYQELNVTNFRPWTNGNTGYNFNSSSIEQSINRTMGIFHRTEVMVNEASEQARNSQLQMEVERSRLLEDTELNDDLEDVAQRETDEAGMNFDANILDMDFNFDETSKEEEDEEDENDIFLPSSSFSLSDGENNLQPNLMPRLRKLIKYFIQKSMELGKSVDSQEKKYQLTFKELVPLRDNEEVNTRRIAAGVFSNVLFLANKNIVSISVEPQGIESWKSSLSKPNGINLALTFPSTT
ncbi:hypothetical protein CANMA_001586 [Candida margitis]|uniref:uncharacterized protein n=1 Tax=Candida margitis TaxID=1775924 RepID=UPI0022264F68|nr:uncharacterized protein CANMA_001586 [Candida margitis]KAI5969518.1 hypothetical protein CANMA_001586 [Candida margitis]